MNREADASQQVFFLGDDVTIRLKFIVDQPLRGPLHRENERRIVAASDLGLRALRPVPRAGMTVFIEPSAQYHVQYDCDEQLHQACKLSAEVAEKIEPRGVGFAQLRAIGELLKDEYGHRGPWFSALGLANSKNKIKEISAACAEWADADSVASHIGHGSQFFCTEDFSRSNSKPSVLDHKNRQWLTKEYFVQFVTIQELAILIR